MKRFLDSSVLVESCLSASPKYAAADALVNRGHATTSAHALAEAYATLSGDARLRIAPADAEIRPNTVIVYFTFQAANFRIVVTVAANCVINANIQIGTGVKTVAVYKSASNDMETATEREPFRSNQP